MRLKIKYLLLRVVLVSFVVVGGPDVLQHDGLGRRREVADVAARVVQVGRRRMRRNLDLLLKKKNRKQLKLPIHHNLNRNRWLENHDQGVPKESLAWQSRERVVVNYLFEKPLHV